MNDIDRLSKQIFRRNDVFCQLFNLLLFNGEEVLSSEGLVDLPTHECRPLGRGETDRDLLKRCTIKMDSAACYVLLGIEEQTKVDYTMPLRVLEYDISRYLWQVQTAANERIPDGARGLSCSEAMDRFGKGDRLFPVITAVVYLGRKPWDGPRSFRDMFPPECRRFEPFLPEYKLTLLSPWELEEERLSALYPDLQGIFSSAKGDDYLSKLLDKWKNTDYWDIISNCNFSAHLVGAFRKTSHNDNRDIFACQLNRFELILHIRTQSRLIAGRNIPMSSYTYNKRILIVNVHPLYSLAPGKSE